MFSECQSEYCDQLEMEAELENENDRKLDRRSWPSAGAISFRNVVMHYKKDDPPVCCDILRVHEVEFVINAFLRKFGYKCVGVARVVSTEFFFRPNV